MMLKREKKTNLYCKLIFRYFVSLVTKISIPIKTMDEDITPSLEEEKELVNEMDFKQEEVTTYNV